ncbi:hypothetical protein QQZ08_003957 [Neonectria magnoliae]|uniref:non-specific serine/threonine protein kinase n=1 Tax=Neonectria magnoliae TaxID=2732573 RepID=A0ABR1I7J8_9HYPO
MADQLPSIASWVDCDFEHSANQPHTTNDGLWTNGDRVEAKIRNRDFAPGPYVRGSLLGSGGWSSVFKVLRLRDEGVFAGKASSALQEMRREASILRSLKHEHIVKYVDWHEDKNTPLATLLVTELCIGGTLQTLIDHSPNGTGRRETPQAILQVALALEYLHGKGLFHSDVKPRNILIRTWEPVNIVLADCADVKPVKFTGKPTGTHTFWSPHLVKHNRHGGLGDDVWALGITLLGMMAQWPPVRTKKEVRLYPRRCFEHARKLEGLNPADDVVQLLGRMLAWEQGTRATATECVRLATQIITEEAKSENQGGLAEANELVIKVPEDFRPITFW